MTLSKKQIVTLIFTLALIFAIPIAIFLTQKKQGIRPQALQGKANFLLSTDSITSTVGKDINVLVSMQLTDPQLKVSGVDFVLLYDKNTLDVANIVPQITSVDANAAFTDAPIVTSGGSFDDTFNFIRVAEVARKPDSALAGGTTAAIKLANITFRGRGSGGQATIKFPDDNKYMEVSGTGSSNGPTYVPGAPPVTSTITPAPTNSATVPNCTALAGPTQIVLGQSGTYVATFYSPQGNLGAEIVAGQNGQQKWNPCYAGGSFNESLCRIAGTAGSPVSGPKTFIWTPTAVGTYDVFCRAWNDGIAECRGSSGYLINAPSNQSLCAGPVTSMTVNVVNGPTIPVQSVPTATRIPVQPTSPPPSCGVTGCPAGYSCDYDGQCKSERGGRDF